MARRIFHRFIRSLHRVQENQEENKMDASNLAIGTPSPTHLRTFASSCEALFRD
jgi:hypothetical protein